MTGKIRWVNKASGYGFIVSKDRNDIFFHKSEVNKEEFEKLSEGNEVEFDLYEVSKGYEAKAVKRK